MMPWGGGDLKYFWPRYFGAGVEGFVLNSDNVSGAVLGTLTVRYPIGCSRFAPYGFAGVGAFFGGEESRSEFFFLEHHTAPWVETGETESIVTHDKTNNDTRVIETQSGPQKHP